MPEQLELPLDDTITSGSNIYEIYKLDTAIYPYSRNYGSHVRFLRANNTDEVYDEIEKITEPSSRKFFDMRPVSRDHLSTCIEKLENQLESYRYILNPS
jgi:hypothetical protein